MLEMQAKNHTCFDVTTIANGDEKVSRSSMVTCASVVKGVVSMLDRNRLVRSRPRTTC